MKENKLTILVVEDSNVAIHKVREAIDGKMTVLHAENLKQARSKVGNNLDKIDLILLDMILPDGTGIEFCDELYTKARHIPIIVLSSITKTENVVEALIHGARDYMFKPFIPEELTARIYAQILLNRDLEKINTSAADTDSLISDLKTHISNAVDITTEIDVEGKTNPRLMGKLTTALTRLSRTVTNFKK